MNKNKKLLLLSLSLFVGCATRVGKVYPVCVVDSNLGGFECESNDKCDAVDQALFSCSTSDPYKKYSQNYSTMDGWVCYPPMTNEFLLKKAAEKKK